MGTYINKGNEAFQVVRNSEYIDKSGMIAVINQTLDTERMYNCITRCRRFGKSIAAKMLYAYYDHSCDSRELFRGLAIEKDASFEKYLNKFPVIILDITSFTTRYRWIILKLTRKGVTPDFDILFFHSGGYFMNSQSCDADFIEASMDKVQNAAVYLALYPLAPAHRVNDGLAMALSIYKKIVFSSTSETLNDWKVEE